jgi:hypothetical protein
MKLEVVPGGAQLLPAPVDLSAAPGILKADMERPADH